MYAIKTENLTKKYKDITAVDRLNLEVKEGELFSLLGVNGAGKTTAIKMLTGITKPNGGDGFILGKSIITDYRAVKEVIGVSPQETAVAPNLSVKENIMFICGVQGLGKKESKQKTDELVNIFTLQSILNKKAGKLSGGWQRRLSIALALASEPKLLFLDEPTLGLDVLARSDLWDLIRELKGKTTIVLTTHYMEEAEALSDRIGIMKDGRLLKVGTAEEFKILTGKEKFEEAFIAVIRGDL